MSKVRILVALFAALPVIAAAPDLLTFDELVTLSNNRSAR